MNYAIGTGDTLTYTRRIVALDELVQQTNMQIATFGRRQGFAGETCQALPQGVNPVLNLPGLIFRLTHHPMIVDNLSTHRATDVLLISLAHPRWEFVSQPKYAAYLNLIEPWRKVLRSLALKGCRFETWDEICAAVQSATAYWNAHRHPFVWGKRRRHRSRRQSGIASLPKVA